MKHFIFTLGLFCSLASFAQTGLMTPDQIREAWQGKRVTGVSARGGEVAMSLKADGSAGLEIPSLFIVDTGTWRLSASGYCTAWKVVGENKERCFTVRREGTTFQVINADGTKGGVFSRIE